MSPITTHVLDTARGCPAAGVKVTLELGSARGEPWSGVAIGHTDDNGRVADLGPIDEPGRYRLRFDTGAYHGPHAFFPEVVVEFSVGRPADHYHVPLLLSPFGYSTYRGS